MTRRHVHIIGAHGRSGRELCKALSARGDVVVPIVRREAPVVGRLSPPRIAALEDVEAVRHALHDAALVVSTASAQYTRNILAALPEKARFVAMGSTRMFTLFEDDFAHHVREALGAIAESNSPSLMLLPSMIYGAEDDITTRRLVALLKRLPIIPLPKNGRMKIQPIHQDDVTLSLMAAIDLISGEKSAELPSSIVIAGPKPISYHAFIRAVMHAAGLRQRPILPVPTTFLKMMLPILGFLPGFRSVTHAEINRLTENRCFSIEDMSKLLHVRPRPLEEGLQALLNPKVRPS